MDRDSFVEHVEDESATELARLGSPKLLVALTDADLDPETVVETAAARSAAMRDVFEAWAAEETDDWVARFFESAAAVRSSIVDDLTADLDGGVPDPASNPTFDRLWELSTTVERAGGLVGWALVADREFGQYVSFFVNEAAPATTDEFRDLRTGVRNIREDALDVLAAACDSADDWTRASDAAESVVRAAYDDYASTLAAMGLDPKPVC